MALLKMEAFRSWLGSELDARNLDKDVFVEYIVSMVEDGADVVSEFLQQTLDDAADADEFSKCIVEYYMDPSLVPKCDGNSSECLLSDVTPEVEPSTASTLSITKITSGPIANEIEKEKDTEAQADISNEDTFLEEEEELLEEDPSYFLEMLQQLEEQIHDTFPHVEFSCEAICASLYACHNNVAYAHETLQYSYVTVSTCKPCRHHLSGRCMRSDCPFEHNMQCIPCTFWLTSGCTNNDCKFMHNVLVPRIEQHVLAVSSIDTRDTSSFPALAPSRTTSNLINPPESSYRDIASKQLSYSPTASASQNKLMTPRSTGTAPLPSWVQSGKLQSMNSLFTLCPLGEAVKVDYESYREEARSLAIARNKLLQEATQAYIR